jgi:cyclophilin family peptidyl-prolyl cis-trans isomerase
VPREDVRLFRRLLRQSGSAATRRRRGGVNADSDGARIRRVGGTSHDGGGETPVKTHQKSWGTEPIKMEVVANDLPSPCPYKSIQDLTDVERYPRASRARHMVDPPSRPIHDGSSNDPAAPPAGNRLTLVCCRTTKGPWSIAVHEAWAPRGSRRFLDMVKSNYFQGGGSNAEQEDEEDDEDSRGVPLMRCVRNFLCQFGLAGKRSERFRAPIEDDPPWLPSGPDHRANEMGVMRFQKGYLSYAGNGVNRRSNQLFVALADSGPLGGGSPWEVPWGELVGNHSYETLDRIYTGYGGKGPTQQLLGKSRALPVVRRDFPQLDWVLSCHVVDEVNNAD